MAKIPSHSDVACGLYQAPLISPWRVQTPAHWRSEEIRSYEVMSSIFKHQPPMEMDDRAQIDIVRRKDVWLCRYKTSWDYSPLKLRYVLLWIQSCRRRMDVQDWRNSPRTASLWQGRSRREQRSRAELSQSPSKEYPHICASHSEES